jgi:hypothetical protein
MSKTLPDRPLRPATLLVRGGTMRTNQDETSEALFLTSGFVYESAEQAEATFAGTATHFQYSRFGNPTVAMLEARLAGLEGAEACRMTATGMAAVHAAMLSHLKTGDRVVASRALFGSCHWIVSTLLPRYGIAAEFVDGGDLAQWERALSQPTSLVLLETPSNPMLEIVDLPKVAALAHQAGAIVVVDTTREVNALLEAKSLGIPTICLIDTDGNPDLADIPIPGNDDSMRSIDIIIRELCAAAQAGRGERTNASPEEMGAAAIASGDADAQNQRPVRRSSRSQFRAEGRSGSASDAPRSEAAPAPGV